MQGRLVDIPTQDGVADAHLFQPEGAGPWPAIIYYTDAMGARAANRAMAARLAGHGYSVLIPNLYYRAGRDVGVDPQKIATDPAEHARMMSLYQSLTHAMVIADTRAFLDFLRQQQGVAAGKAGCVGYCMGAGLTIDAAGSYPDRIGASAGIHGAFMATDQPDSPHLLVPQIKGEVYIGVAEIDPFLVPGETERLDAALKDAGVRYTMETFPGVQHGFALDDAPVYSRDAAERHWQQILALFERALKQPLTAGEGKRPRTA